MNLRPYQQQAISDLRMAYRSGAQAPLLVAPTGAGKTIILAAITQAAAGRGRRILILVHRRELIRQTSAKLAHAGVSHGIIAAGFEPSDHPGRFDSVRDDHGSLARRSRARSPAPMAATVRSARH